MPRENENGAVETGNPAGADTVSDDTSTDFDSGFGTEDFDDLTADLPVEGAGQEGAQPAPGEGEAGADADPTTVDQGEGQDAAQQQDGQPQGGQQQDPSQQAGQQQQQQGQDAGYLNSTAPLDQILHALTQNEDAIVDAVAKQQLQLSEADKEALETDAVAAMPKIGARLYVKSLQAATSLMRNMVPQMLQTEMNKHQALMSVEQAFFSQYPQLDRWKHGRDIVAVGQAIKAQNPQMPPQELLRQIANAVMGMHGISRAPQRRPGNGQQPFRPAQSGARMGQPDPAQDNPFAGLGLEFDE